MIVARRLFLTFAAASLLAACASHKENQKIFSGRFSLIYRSENPENFSGKFRLRVGPDESTLELMTPLSGIVAVVTESSSGATFRRSLMDQPTTGKNAQDLSLKLIGVPIPLEFMKKVLIQGRSFGKVQSEGWTAESLNSRLIKLSTMLRGRPLEIKIVLDADEA